MKDPPLAEPHYQLVCYVGPAGTKPAPFEGWATFTQVYMHGADGCRYAVVKDVAGNYLVWDLDNVPGVPAAHAAGLTTPEPKWRGDSADGLIMKAMALYD